MTGVVAQPIDGVRAAPATAVEMRGGRRRRAGGGTRYLVGAVCLFICVVMVLPLVASVLASVKTTEEAAQTPPTYVPHGLSFDAYKRLWDYQSGLPTYLLNSFGTALLTVRVHARADDLGRLRVGTLPDPVQGTGVRGVAPGVDHSVPGAPDADRS